MIMDTAAVAAWKPIFACYLVRMSGDGCWQGVGLGGGKSAR